MKRGRINYWVVCISFFLGALISYILTQFEFLEIDTKVNITESIFSISTIIVGLYIAVALKKNQDRNQNLYKHLHSKLDLTWESFLTFSNRLKFSDHIILFDVVKEMKGFDQKLSPLKIMFASFNLETTFLLKIEQSIDILEAQLCDESVIEDNIINYSAIKAKILKSIDEIDEFFAKSFNYLNHIV